METELKTELLETLKSIRATPAERNRFADILNAPFTVTIMGGLLLAIVSGLVTHYATEAEKSRDIELEKLRQKQAFVDTFSTKMKMYYDLTLSVRRREIFLKDWEAVPPKNRMPYPDGRTYEETRDRWEDEKRFWLDHSTGNPIGLVSTAKILFSKKEVLLALDDLGADADEFEHATDYLVLNRSAEAAFTHIEKAALEMAAEIHEK